MLGRVKRNAAKVKAHSREIRSTSSMEAQDQLIISAEKLEVTWPLPQCHTVILLGRQDPMAPVETSERSCPTAGLGGCAAKHVILSGTTLTREAESSHLTVRNH